MTQGDVPIGKLFTEVYRERGEPVEDSQRMRLRLAALLSKSAANEVIGEQLELRLGKRPLNVGHGLEWRMFVPTLTVDELMDTITLVWRYFDWEDRQYDRVEPLARGWTIAVSEMFSQENIRFRLDERGGVHPIVDTAFYNQMAAAIAALEGPRYRAALKSFERGADALGERPPDGKGAIRGVFGTAEILFRLIAPKAPRLGAAEVKQHLAKVIEGAYSGDSTATRSGQRMLRSFCEWIDAAHFYRHEEGHEEPKQPPFDLAVLLVSQGAGFVRWLAQLDRASRKDS